jgi:hypothetical protein
MEVEVISLELRSEEPEITCSIPKAQIHRGAINHHVCTEIIEDSGYVILQNANRSQNKLEDFSFLEFYFRLFITMSST